MRYRRAVEKLRTLWLDDWLRLSKGGFAYRWRSHREPVWNYAAESPARGGDQP